MKLNSISKKNINPENPCWLILAGDDWIRENSFSKNDFISSKYIKNSKMIGVKLVDVKGDIWRISSIIDEGHKWGAWGRLWEGLGFSQIHKIRYAIEHLYGDGLAEIKQRICLWIRNNPDQWVDEHWVDEEKGGWPYDEKKLASYFIDRIESAQSQDEIWDIVDDPFRDVDWKQMLEEF